MFLVNILFTGFNMEVIMQKDYYLVLGISRGADLNKIKKAYRTIAKRLHPDVSNEKESERFIEIKEAYDTLSDHEKKRRYDTNLENEDASYRLTRAPGRMQERIKRFRDAESLFYTKTDDLFEGFIPGLYDQGNEDMHEKDLYFDAVLTPEEAASGGLYPISVPVMAPCPVCSRSGFWEGLYCPLCKGFGRISTVKKFALSMPANVSDGTEINLSLEGIGMKECYLHISVHIADY
jgi:DnaJ-class molecular chaperone